MSKHWKRLAVGLPIVAAAFAAVAAVVLVSVRFGFELGLIAAVLVFLTITLAYCVGLLVENLQNPPA